MKNKNRRYLMTNGYIQCTDVEKNIYVYEHRYVWEKHYGSIPEGLVIHHKDGDRTNNTIINLELMTKQKHDKLTLEHNVKKNIRKTFKVPHQVDIPKQELKDLLDFGLSLRFIGTLYSVTKGVIKRNMRDHNLLKPKDKKIHKVYNNIICKSKKNIKKQKSQKVFIIKKQHLYDLINFGFSQRYISKLYNTSHTTIQRNIKEYNLNR